MNILENFCEFSGLPENRVLTSSTSILKTYLRLRCLAFQNQATEVRKLTSLYFDLGHNPLNNLVKKLVDFQSKLLGFEVTQLKALPQFEAKDQSEKWFQAEVDYWNGMLHLARNENQRASSCFIKANRKYQECEAFEYAMDASYQDLRCLLRENDSFAYRIKLTQTLSSPQSCIENSYVKCIIHKIKAMDAINNEDFQFALENLDQAIGLQNVINNTFELGELFVEKTYVMLIEKKYEQFDFFWDSESVKFADLSEHHRTLLEEFQRIRFLDKYKKTDIHEAAQRCESLCASSEEKSQFIHCLLEFVEKKEDFGLLLNLSKMAIEMAKEMDCLRWFWPFKYYELKALLHLGRIYQGKNALLQFEMAARKNNHAARKKKAKQLETMYFEIKKNEEDNGAAIQVSLLDFKFQKGDAIISFSHDPQLFLAIISVLGNAQGCSVSTFFKTLKGKEYCADVDRAELIGAIQQADEMMGGNFIELDNETIRINARLEWDASSLDLGKVKVSQRRVAISLLLQRSSKPLSISDIVAGLHFKRRTLQLDLQQMTNDGLIKASGQRKGRKYSPV